MAPNKKKDKKTPPAPATEPEGSTDAAEAAAAAAPSPPPSSGEKPSTPAAAAAATETTGLLPGGGAGDGIGSNPPGTATLEPASETRPLVHHEEEEDERPRKPIMYRFFAAFSGFAAIVSLSMLALQVASGFVIRGVFAQYLLRVYVGLFCAMFALAEFQADFFLRRAPAFASWFQRGFLYTLIGAVVIEESFATIGQAYPEYPSVELHVVAVGLRVLSTAMFAVGVLYMIMGVFCLRGVWENVQERYREEVAERREHTMDV